MNVLLTEKARMICADYSERNCYACPLAKPCGSTFNDSHVKWANRMNDAAEKLEQEAA